MGVRTIMLVDDAEEIRTIAGTSLEKIGGWEVIEASSGAEAIALVATRLPDLILLDLVMPDMGGAETLARLREATPGSGPPVILMTASAAVPKEVRAVGGVLGLIRKPFDPMTLPEQIRALLRTAPVEAAAPAPELDDVRSRYLARLPTRVAQMQETFARERAAGGELPELQHQAHRLSGSAGSHGQMELGEVCQRIEALARRAGGGDEAVAGELEAQLARARELVRSFDSTDA